MAHNGKIINAAIYLPAFNELYYAEDGSGAYLNDVKINCSNKKDWLGSHGLGVVRYSPEYVKFLELCHAVSEGTVWTNSFGSPAVSSAWMAAGKRDWYISPGKNSWDFAAPYLITKESGCVVTNFNGENWSPGSRGIVVSNEHLHAKLLEMVKEAYGLL